MNRILLAFSAAMLASASVLQNANAENNTKLHIANVASSQALNVKKPVARGPLSMTQGMGMKKTTGLKKASGLADNQHYMGPYYTDDCQTDSQYGIGIGAGTFKAGVVIDYPQAVKFNGGKIVAIRYAVCDAITNPRVYVNTISGSGVIGNEVVSQQGGDASIGWNTVTLDTPYIIDVDGSNVAAFMIGFEYTAEETSYPVSAVTLSSNPSLYIYGQAENSSVSQWYDLGTSYGALCVQCIVEKDGGFHTVDAVLSDFSIQRYVKSGGKANISFKCSSFFDDITSAKFGVKFGDNEVAELNYDGTIDFDGVNISTTIDTPSDFEVGKWGNVSLYVKELNGTVPTDVNTTLDDVVSGQFVPYTTSFDRQKQLVEFYTSQYGQYCPYGDNVLTDLSKLRDDLAMVGIHASMTSGTDTWALDDSNTLISFSTSSVPSAAFNRYYLNSLYNSDGRVAVATDYNDEYAETAANLISTKLIDGSNNDYPAFATIDLATTYDSDSRKLNIKVSGQNVADFTKVMGDDAVLTVCLTQDNQKGKQLVGNSSQYNYANNNVLRKFVSAPLGDAISWDGTSYEKNYEVTLPNTWTISKKQQVNVVAFISRPIKYKDSEFTTSVTDAWVTNANSCVIGESTTGIDSTISDMDDAHEVARYSLGGARLSAPVKGVNIVKYSNGKTLKVIVK